MNSNPSPILGSHASEERKQGRVNQTTGKLFKAVQKAAWYLGQHVRACHRTRTEPGLQFYIGVAAERWYTAWGKSDEHLVDFEKAQAPNLFIAFYRKAVDPNVLLGNFGAVGAANATTEIWQVIDDDSSSIMQINMFEWRDRRGAREPNALVALNSSNLLPEITPAALMELMQKGFCTDPYIACGSPEPKYLGNRGYSADVQEIIDQGPVLSLDIDGVLSPMSHNLCRSPFPTTPPGFVCGVRGAETHQTMNDWLCRLAAVFPTIVWNSSWGGSARGFAQSTGLTVAVDWPNIHANLSWKYKPREFLDPPNNEKLHGLMTKINPHLPLAVLDDHHVGYKLHAKAGECLLSRPGPTLVVAPNPQVGIGVAMVDKLVDWAREPYHTRAIMGMYGHESRYGDSPCFWRHGNCADPHGYGQPGTGWVEREGGRPIETRLLSWRKGWWDRPGSLTVHGG